VTIAPVTIARNLSKPSRPPPFFFGKIQNQFWENSKSILEKFKIKQEKIVGKNSLKLPLFKKQNPFEDFQKKKGGETYE